MCFSATASLVAGTSLSAIGVATVSKVRHRSELPFALIPLLFGIKQLIEGGIWLTFSRDAPMLRQILTVGYSLFSHVLWPIYKGLQKARSQQIQTLAWNTILGDPSVYCAIGVWVSYMTGLYSCSLTLRSTRTAAARRPVNFLR